MADKDNTLDTKVADDMIAAIKKRKTPKEDVIVPSVYKAPEDAEGLVEVFIDPTMTRGGLMTNGVKYIGRVKVTQDVADDLMRRQEEIQAVNNWQFAETKSKPKLKIQNHQILEQQFLADPENRGRKGFTEEYGLMDPWQWQYLAPSFQEYLKETRRQMYGY